MSPTGMETTVGPIHRLGVDPVGRRALEDAGANDIGQAILLPLQPIHLYSRYVELVGDHAEQAITSYGIEFER